MATSTAEMDQFREQLEAAARARMAQESRPALPSKAALLEAAEKGSDEALGKEAADAAAAAAAASKGASADFDSAERRELRLKLLDKSAFVPGDAPAKPDNGDAVSSNAQRRVDWMLGMVRADPGGEEEDAGVVPLGMM